MIAAFAVWNEKSPHTKLAAAMPRRHCFAVSSFPSYPLLIENPDRSYLL